MIPDSISKADVEEAVRRIKRDGVPPKNRSRGHCLVAEGEHLPPKLAIARAQEVVTGKPLNVMKFKGGAPTNRFLKKHGFDVISCGCGGVL